MAGVVALRSKLNISLLVSYHEDGGKSNFWAMLGSPGCALLIAGMSSRLRSG